MMTKEEIRMKIKTIKANTYDYELAHMLEDELYRDFVVMVAKRKDRLGEKARLILLTDKIEFHRYCA